MHPILVTGAGGQVGGIGPKIVDNLLQRNVPVRALLHTADARAAALEKLGAEVVVGDLTSLDDMHRVIAGCQRIYFGMSVSPQYLEATANVAAVAKHHGIEALVNISQMTVSQMSITQTTPSPQHKLHWLAEQVLNWSGLPVVHVRPTVFLENFFFLKWASESIARDNTIRLPFGAAKTSPVSTVDVAQVITEILLQPKGHIGKVYELTGAKSQTLAEIAQEYALALGRPIRYVEVTLADWQASGVLNGLPPHVAAHIATMALLHSQNRYDRASGDVQKILGRPPLAISDWVRLNRTQFTGTATGG